MGQEERFLNFPIQLLKGFLSHPKEYLSDILYFALFKHSQKMELGDEMENFKAASRYYKVTLGNEERALRLGAELAHKYEGNNPQSGINLKTYWDFYNNHKSEFDKICLLAFLALKSIIGNKTYCKTTNKFWLARMDGKVKSCEFSELSKEVRQYANEYQTKKIKMSLQMDWYLSAYSYFTRGLYVSFDYRRKN